MYRRYNVAGIVRYFSLDMYGEDLVIDGVGLCNRPTEYTSILSYVESAEFIKVLKRNKAVKCLIISNQIYQEYKDELPDITFLITEKAEETFYQIFEYLVKETDFFTVDKETAIGIDCRIHPSAILEKGVTIGNDVTIGPNCCILGGAIIRDHVKICAGTVIGENGFQVIHYEKGLRSIPHVGGTYIDSGVFIGANTVIARSLFEGYTRIGKNTQIGDHVVVSHNCEVQENVTLVSGCVLTGSAYVERGAFIGAGSSISNKVRIGENSFVGIGSTVTRKVKSGLSVYSEPAKTYEELLVQRRNLTGR